MKALLVAATVGLSVLGALNPATAQMRGGPDYDYGDRGGYRDRDREDYRDRDEYRDRGYRERGGYAFDEREYLRCNPDVRRAIAAGQMESGAAHYRTFGRREHRPLSC
jgi:hypothetical protein